MGNRNAGAPRSGQPPCPPVPTLARFTGVIERAVREFLYDERDNRLAAFWALARAAGLADTYKDLSLWDDALVHAHVPAGGLRDGLLAALRGLAELEELLDEAVAECDMLSDWARSMRAHEQAEARDNG